MAPCEELVLYLFWLCEDKPSHLRQIHHNYLEESNKALFSRPLFSSLSWMFFWNECERVTVGSLLHGSRYSRARPTYSRSLYGVHCLTSRYHQGFYCRLVSETQCIQAWDCQNIDFNPMYLSLYKSTIPMCRYPALLSVLVCGGNMTFWPNAR